MYNESNKLNAHYHVSGNFYRRPLCSNIISKSATVKTKLPKITKFVVSWYEIYFKIWRLQYGDQYFLFAKTANLTFVITMRRSRYLLLVKLLRHFMRSARCTWLPYFTLYFYGRNRGGCCGFVSLCSSGAKNVVCNTWWKWNFSVQVVSLSFWASPRLKKLTASTEKLNFSSLVTKCNILLKRHHHSRSRYLVHAKKFSVVENLLL